jgi:hypothetical protein
MQSRNVVLLISTMLILYMFYIHDLDEAVLSRLSIHKDICATCESKPSEIGYATRVAFSKIQADSFK